MAEAAGDLNLEAIFDNEVARPYDSWEKLRI
jgi:hypothetical protein